MAQGPPQPTPQHPSGLPTGVLAVHFDGPYTTAGVRVLLNERFVDLTMPTTVLRVYAGRHRLEVAGRHGLVTTFGETEAWVEVAPGQRVDLYYSLPRTIFSQGQLAPTPQPRSWAVHWGNVGWAFGVPLVVILLLGVGVALWQAIT